MRRGHGDTALNSHLQVHQRVIQMNLREGQGRWGERHQDQRDRVCVCVCVWPEKSDISFSPRFAQREIVLSLYENIHIPWFDPSAPFLFLRLSD